MNAVTRSKLNKQADALALAYNATTCTEARNRINKARKETLAQLDPTKKWKATAFILAALLVGMGMVAHAWHFAAMEYKAAALEFCVSASGGEMQVCKGVLK